MSRISIKWRITLWVTLLMLVIVLSVLGFMFASSDVVSQMEAQNRLVAVVEDNAEEVEYDDGVLEIDEDDFDFYRNSVTAVVYSQVQQVIAGQVPKTFPDDTPLEEGEPRLVGTGGRQFFVYDRKVVFRRDPPVWIRGILPLEAVPGAMGDIVRLALVALPFLVVMAAAGGYWITRRAFRPVREINRTVESITEGRDLSRRIEIGEGQDEIHSLARTFNGMLRRLEESFDAETQFVSDVSHELRTPVSVILAQCEYALEEGRGADDRQEALEAARRQAARMHRLISHLLAITRMQQGTQALSVERVDVSALVADMCAEQADAAPEGTALRTQIQPDVTAETDAGLLTRLFENLVRNAYQYGVKDGEVRVALWEERGIVSLSVSDDGPGIPPQEQPKIWRRFYQVNPSRTAADTGSMGLGLAMVRQIAHLLGGEVILQSAPGQGSTFTLTFPAK